MKTKLLDATQAGAVEQAAVLLKRGRLVIFPTDTLYGIGADAFNSEAVAILYAAKQRPRSKGIPILLADPEDLDRVAQELPPRARSLIENFWPGPLTLVVPRRLALPDNVSPNANVAVRVPNNDVARSLIRAAGGAVATSSANKTGRPPAHDAQEAMAALSGSAAAVLDGGPVAYGAPSTIVDCTADPPRILREGPLSAATLSLEV